MPRFDADLVPPRPSGRPPDHHVTTVNMATGEILAVADAHTERAVRRLIRRADRRRARDLRAASVSSWHLSRAR